MVSLTMKKDLRCKETPLPEDDITFGHPGLFGGRRGTTRDHREDACVIRKAGRQAGLSALWWRPESAAVGRWYRKARRPKSRLAIWDGMVKFIVLPDLTTGFTGTRLIRT